MAITCIEHVISEQCVIQIYIIVYHRFDMNVTHSICIIRGPNLEWVKVIVEWVNYPAR